jgi:hypothetical protein
MYSLTLMPCDWASFWSAERVAPLAGLDAPHLAGGETFDVALTQALFPTQLPDGGAIGLVEGFCLLPGLQACRLVHGVLELLPTHSVHDANPDGEARVSRW